jgi:signal recognition particle subunit SRP54
MGQDAGLLGNIPGMKNLAMARNMRRAMKGGQIPGMPGGFPGMPGGFPGMPGMGLPGMGFPGMGMPGVGVETPRMKALSRTEKNAKKNQRKRERDARKKNKGKR